MIDASQGRFGTKDQAMHEPENHEVGQINAIGNMSEPDLCMAAIRKNEVALCPAH